MILIDAGNTTEDSPAIMVPLSFIDQQSPNSVKRQLQNFSGNIGVQIKPVFQSKKIGQVLAPKEKKPPIVTINAWFTNLNVICAMQIIKSGTPTHQRAQILCNREAPGGTWPIKG